MVGEVGFMFLKVISFSSLADADTFWESFGASITMAGEPFYIWLYIMKVLL